jgi:hypothetical protein
MIRRLLDEALVWFDLEGSLGVGVFMALDLGILGEVCEAMMVISEKGMEFGMETGEWLELRKRGEPSSLNHLIGLRTLRIKEFES